MSWWGSSSGWTRLRTAEDHLVQAGEIKSGALTAAFATREKAIRDPSTAVAAAQAAHQAAQSEGAAATAARSALALPPTRAMPRRLTTSTGCI
jgi:hypothetical protein